MLKLEGGSIGGWRVAVTWLKPFPEPPSIFCRGHGFFLCLLHGVFFRQLPESWTFPLSASWVMASSPVCYVGQGHFPFCYLGHDLLPRWPICYLGHGLLPCIYLGHGLLPRMLPEPYFFCMLPRSWLLTPYATWAMALPLSATWVIAFYPVSTWVMTSYPVCYLSMTLLLSATWVMGLTLYLPGS